ncbi:MAG: cadherin domain-containing protein [Campylobacteraceae bacterium]|nr:cadherin domain-containing protein [Campylobacteraceae bacterium]
MYVTYQTDMELSASVKEMQDIIVRIKVPGHDDTRVVSLKVLDSLSGGHIADIKISDRGESEVVLKDDFAKNSVSLYYYQYSTTGYGVSTGGSAGTNNYYSEGYAGDGGHIDTGYTTGGGWSTPHIEPPKDYEYSILWLIPRILLGPLAGANITVYELKDYDLNTNRGSNPVYSGLSSYGSSIYTAGVITVPREITDALSDEKLYVVEAKGGMDIDANDDKIFDANPVINLGTVRAVTSGSALKNTGFKLNILTEMAYQISKKHYNSNDILRLIAKSDEAVKCLLNSDINLDNVTNSIDALYFTPYENKNSLYRDYYSDFMPLINKIHKGEDIYEDSFNLYAKPLVRGGYFSVNEDAAIGTIMGRINTDCVSESPVHSFNLSGAGSENFEVDNQGNIKVAKRLVYEEKRIYYLSVIGTNAYGDSPAEPVYITVTADNSPIITTNSLVNYLFENMPNGSYMGTISVNDMGYPITDMRLEGYGAEYFNIDSKGNITVTHGENITLSDKVYRLTVTATNAFGDSAPVSVVFNIYDDAPVILGNVYASILDNATSGTAIGRPSYQEGLSAVKEFRLTGAGVENFNVSIDGTVRVAENAALSVENSPYLLYISAKNEQGVSEPGMVIINIIPSQASGADNNAVSYNITLYDFAANIYVSAHNNSIVGKIAYSYGYTPPKAFSLSGVGSERFSISSNGVITLIDNTNLNAGEVFNLEANASNEYFSNTKSQVKITVIDDYLTLYSLSVSIVEGLDAGTAIGRVGYSYGVLPAVSFEFEGNDAAYFTIDNNGVIRVASILNYNTNQEYSFNVKAANGDGKTSTSKVTVKIIDDAPILADTALNIMENSYGGETVGYVRVSSSGKSSINSFTLSGEGAEHFNINNQGLIKVAIGATKIDYETKSIYSLKATASNSHDTSKAVNVTINVINAPDEEPTLIPTTLSIYENSPTGTVVGNVDIFSHGSDTINSFVIVSGTNSDWFAIDDTSKITTTELANLDYENKKSFTIKVKASNIYGESNIVDVTININNLPDSPPTVNGPTFYINENSPEGTFVGQLSMDDDGSPVTSITLSGTEAENFKVYNNGTIVVAEGAKLDYESRNYYYLYIQAVNAFGNGNTATVYIGLNNLKDTPPVLQNSHFSVHRKTPANKTIGTIQSGSSIHCDITEYVLDDNSVFDVRDNGEVYTTANVTEGSNYTMNIYAKSSCGDSNIVKLTVDTKNRIISQIDGMHNVKDIALSSDNTKIFIADYSVIGSLRIIDVSDPANPILIGQIDALNIYDVTLSSDNTKVFIADIINGLKIIDVSNPVNPVLIGQFPVSGMGSIVLSSDNTKAFVADYIKTGNLRIIDVSNPVNPVLIGQFPVSYADTITLSPDETKAFVGSYDYDCGCYVLKIIDVSNPKNPTFINQISTYNTKDIILSSDGTKAFIADSYDGFKIIDIRDLTNLTIIGQISTFVTDIALSSDETKVFATDGPSLKVMDVSDPINPVFIDQFYLYGVYDIIISSDDTKVFTSTQGGLKIIDIEGFTKE